MISGCTTSKATPALVLNDSVLTCGEEPQPPTTAELNAKNGDQVLAKWFTRFRGWAGGCHRNLGIVRGLYYTAYPREGPAQ